MTTILDGKKISDEIRAEVKAGAEALRHTSGVTPGLAFILVGENPASQSYVKSKGIACEEAGFYGVTERLPESTQESELLALIARFNADEKIHGILVQLPLPKHINEQRVIEAIDPSKDVDGFHPANIGKVMIGMDTFFPCTPAGILEILKRYNLDPSGKHVVVVGRSNIVGKPIANMLVQKKEWCNAIVTMVHTGTSDIASYTRQADILIAAIGKARAITAGMVKPGAVVIDVGINRISDPTAKSGSRIVGDVDFESVSPVSSAITPVPGGVGKMTIAMLLVNTLKAASISVAR
ncbi:MAG TPA: bifunctional methylenetetrahydrofolate dehydrogenase/methenyltetrahydrofolate cyclohydrolase FolD [Bacteroidota bacterium]|nr:bifunctional methylenetetrahydrofolate dehydrogenase/methenyltetrahydrofolate cyclohydrolase FolD [Bacteroidota bacterium]